MKSSMDLFFSGSVELKLEDWEQMIQALVTYGDTLWIDANMQISNRLFPEIHAAISKTLKELKEEEIVLTWKLEASLAGEPAIVNKVIDIEEHRNLYENINYAILDGEESEIFVGSTLSTEVERTSKIIDYRKELWNLGIASLCGANGIVYRTLSSSKQLLSSSFYKYEMLNKKYTQHLFKKFKIPSLWSLSTNDILDLRKKAKHLRSQLDLLLSSKIFEIGVPEKKIIKECERLYDSYLSAVKDIIDEKSHEGLFASTSKDVAVGVSGLIFPIMGLYPIAERFAQWFNNKEQYGFVLYMMELQSRAFRSMQARNKY